MENNKSLIAYQGVQGAFGELAALKFFKCKPENLFACDSFENVFKMVADKEVKNGVVPIENSLAGSIYKNFDLLMKYDLRICGEIQLRISHNLIAFQGVKTNQIKKVYSHIQGLNQCEMFLDKHPKIERLPYFNTAGSVKHIKENDLKDSAAIASKEAAALYDMKILKRNIEDNPQNFTRFLILSASSDIPANADKTSIVFSLPEDPGSLFKSLSVFALRDIGISKIESRPLHGSPWQYYFYLDFEGSMTKKKSWNAINHLKEFAKYLKILGSYPDGLK